MDLDWGDEPWIKVYVRDWADWMALPLRAKAVFLLVVRKLDRAGVLPLGRTGLPALPALLGHPEEAELILAGAQHLITAGWWQITDGALLYPEHLDMQAARTTDRKRAQASRERRRAQAMQGQLLPESSHSASPGVTAHHSASRVDKTRSDQTRGSPAPPAGRKASEAEGEYAWAMQHRVQRRPAIVSDQPLRAVVLNIRLGAVLKEVGSTGFRSSWLAYLEDPRRSGTAPPWSFAYFLAIWRTYYRPTSGGAAAPQATEIKPGESLYGRR